MSGNSRWMAAAMLLMPLCVAAADDGIVYKPLKFGGVQELGTIVEGTLANEVGKITSNSKTRLENEWLDHFGTFLEQDVTVDRHLELQLGLGGVFEFPKPEYVIPKYGSSMYKLFFFGPSVAKAMYSFGNPEQPIFSLGGGLFPYKYNPDAVDLGEYLFRSGPYPTYIMTGGVTFVNDNSAYLQGLHAKIHVQNLTVDGLLITETSLPPLYDWSVGILADYQIAGGLADVGAGVNFKRLIQVRPSRTQREVPANAYFTRSGTTYYGNADYYQQQQNFYKAFADSLGKRGRSADSAVSRGKADALKNIVDSMSHWLNPADPSYVPENQRSYYTPAGVLLMAHASLDLKKLVRFNAGDAPFKLFAEAAILGWKDYPVFYEDRWKRAPVMLGAHLPTFGLLDQLTLQFEYFNSPWSNNTYNLGSQNLAIPSYPDGLEPLLSKSEYNDISKHDNYAWVVLLRRQLYPHLNLSAQFARDHMRTIGTNWFYGGRLEPSEVLYRNSNWYWMTQLGWSL